MYWLLLIPEKWITISRGGGDSDAGNKVGFFYFAQK